MFREKNTMVESTKYNNLIVDAKLDENEYAAVFEVASKDNKIKLDICFSAFYAFFGILYVTLFKVNEGKKIIDEIRHEHSDCPFYYDKDEDAYIFNGEAIGFCGAREIIKTLDEYLEERKMG